MAPLVFEQLAAPSTWPLLCDRGRRCLHVLELWWTNSGRTHLIVPYYVCCMPLPAPPLSSPLLSSHCSCSTNCLVQELRNQLETALIEGKTLLISDCNNLDKLLTDQRIGALLMRKAQFLSAKTKFKIPVY